MTHYSNEYHHVRRRPPLGVHHIEGEYVTLDDVRKRLGIESMRDARNALRKARRIAGDGPVTWKLVGVK